MAEEIQKSEQEKQSVPEAPVVEERYYCANCREHKGVDAVKKETLNFKTNEDGTLSSDGERFSVFCKKCNGFLRIYDVATAKKVDEMINKKP